MPNTRAGPGFHARDMSILSRKKGWGHSPRNRDWLRGECPVGLVQIEAIGIHDLGPGRNKVIHELLLAVILGIDFCI